jgi:peptidoglycan/xylan/chitin deacetylase (PgdA/CDA1 family)
MIGRLVLAVLLAITPLSAAEPIRVLVFTTTDCPISNRYAPEITRLSAKFDRQATFVLVYPVPSDSPELIRAHKKKFAYAIESIRDADRKLLKMTGVTVTPEVAVMRGSQILYRGRIDDRYVELGRERPKATQHDLENALTAAIAGKPITQRETQAIGCILSDLVK